MRKLAEFITKYAWPILIVLLIITVYAGVNARNLSVNDDITQYISQDDPEIKFYTEVSEKFSGPQENMSMIAIEYDDLFTLDHLKRFKTIVDKLEDAPFVVSLNSFLNMPKIVSTDEGMEVKDTVEVFPKTEEEAKELKKSLLADSMINGKFISPDGKVGLIMVETKEGMDGTKLKKAFKDIVEPLKGDAVKVVYFGMPLISAEIAESSTDTMRLSFISALVILLVLYFCFRSLRGVFLPILVAFLASIWVMGFVGATGKSVTMMISTIPVLMISLATAYGIHFLSRYYEERHNLGPIDAVKMTIEDTFVPIFMSALTTMAGFASLMTAAIRPMTEFGIFSTLGVFFAFVLATFFLGSLYRVFPPKKVHEKFSYESNDIITRLLRMLSNSILNKKGLIVVFFIVMIGLSIFYGIKVRPESSIESRLGKNNQIVKTMDYFKDKFGGVDFLYVYVKSENVKNPYVLRKIEDIEKYSEHLPALREPSSIADFVIQLNDAMENKRIIPADPSKIDNLWFFAGSNKYITSMIGDKDEDTIAQIRTREMTSNALTEAIDKLNKFIAKIPKKVKAVDLPSLDENERKKYYPYIADEIIDALSVRGVKIKDKDGLKKELVSLMAKPLSGFKNTQDSFIDKIIAYSSLELEDMGIDKKELKPILIQYIKDNKTEDELLKMLVNKFELSDDDADYLVGVLTDSEEMALEREKVKAAKTMTEKYIGQKLEDDIGDILWYVMDNVAYVPDLNGNITLSFKLTGIPVITNRINDSLLRSQIKSMGIAFVAVFLMLSFQFGSLFIGILTIIPILLTIVTSFGLMGLLHIDLNISTIMVASIAIGAGIDYTIHYVTRYKNELQRRSKIDALKITMTGTGRAIVFNSISVAAGLYVLSFSTIRMMAVFGELIGSVMLISVVYTLLLLPILLNYANFKEEVKR